jgi:hypothetical protein
VHLGGVGGLILKKPFLFAELKKTPALHDSPTGHTGALATDDFAHHFAMETSSIERATTHQIYPTPTYLLIDPWMVRGNTAVENAQLAFFPSKLTERKTE